ncbi:outer membrane protein assembly factor BamA [Candidatus Fermentibacteria bacterium]|nr:outer membrane protein assembly factor BamA [Candidatus Fermentibacteria bacterium]
MRRIALVCLVAVVANAEQITTDIRVQGAATLDSSFVLRTAGLRSDVLHTSMDLADAVRRLYRAGLVDDVQVYSRPAVGGRELTLAIRERPPLASVEFTGNKRISTDDLQKKVPLIKGQRVSQARIENYAALIRRTYREEGYLKARVETQIDSLAAGTAVVYRIEEGPKVIVRQIRIEGAEAIEAKAVAKRMKLKPKGFLRGGKFDRAKLEESFESIEAFYRERGYLDAAVVDHRVEYHADSSSVTVALEVDEGRMFRVGSFALTFDDSLSYSEESLLGFIKLNPGDPFNYARLEKGVRSMYERFQEDGYLWARVIPDERRTGDVVDYTFAIHQGPPAMVRLIRIEGNTTTKEKVIRRELLIYPGDRFRRSALVRSHREVYNLGFFEDVAVDFDNPSTEGDVDFVVKVKEKSSGQFNFGVTYSSQTRLMGFIQLSHPNVLGNGWISNLRWEFGKANRNIEFGFTEPWLLGTPTRAGFDLYNTESNYYYADYSVERRGGGINVGRPLPWVDYVSASFAYSLSDVRVSPDDDYTGSDLPEGWQTTSRTTYRVVRDSRDNFLEPTRGSRSILTMELAGRVFGGDVAYRKHEVQTSWFTPLASKLIASVSLKAGSVVGYPGRSDVPVYEQFRPGGTSTDGTVRGYEDYSLGPVDATGYYSGGRVMAVLNAELKVPVVPEQVAIIGFFDTGNAWRSFDEVDLGDMKRGMGVGIRINTGIMGIIGLDYGYGFDRESPGWKPHFQFGAFM